AGIRWDHIGRVDHWKARRELAWLQEPRASWLAVRPAPQGCMVKDVQYLPRRVVHLRHRLLLLALLRHVPLFAVIVLGARRRLLLGTPHPILLRPRPQISHGAERGMTFSRRMQ